MIGYNKKQATKAFTDLANILDETAKINITGDAPLKECDILNTLKSIIDADPICNPIRMAFEKAWDIAAIAGDTEMERELHKRHKDLIETYNVITNADDTNKADKTYQRDLISHAAWIRAVSESIDDTGKRLDDTENILKSKDVLEIKDEIYSAKNAVDELVKTHHADKVTQEQLLAKVEETNSLVKAHLPPRPDDYQVTQEQLAKMLEAKNCPKNKRTISRWEQYLNGNYENGTKPPEKYTLQTRLTLQSAQAWVDFYAAQENSKLKIKTSFEARFGRT